MDYAVMLHGSPVGKVQVTRKGLYYHFFCRCRVPKPGIYRLFVDAGGGAIRLGVLAPVDDGFGVETKLPMKQFGEGEMQFSLVQKGEEQPVNQEIKREEGKKETFVPLSPQEPFSYLERLKDGYLARLNGQTGVMLPIDSVTPTGQ